MVWPGWLWIGTPVKFSLWLMNRIATGTGLLYLWRRVRSRWHFWAWFMLVNTVSLGLLAGLFFWMYQRAAAARAVRVRLRPHAESRNRSGEPIDRNHPM